MEPDSALLRCRFVTTTEKQRSLQSVVPGRSLTFMGTQPHGNRFYADVADFLKTLFPRSGFQVPVVQGFSVWVVLAFWVSTDCLWFPGPPVVTFRMSPLYHTPGATPRSVDHRTGWKTVTGGDAGRTDTAGDH